MINYNIKASIYKLINPNLPWKDIETSVREILTVTSENLDIDCHWTFNYHYFVKRPKGTTFVFRARHPKLPYPVAVKYLHQQGSEPSARIHAEYAKLTDLYGKLAPEHRSIVARPFALTSHGYACEWVNLVKMKTILLACAFAQSRRQKCIEAAAINLRLMHDALGPSTEPMNTAVLVDKLKASGGTSNAWNVALKGFIELSGEFDDQMVPHGPIHADYTPGNILFGKERCVIFDFGRSDKFEPIYSDIVFFLMYVGAYSTFGSKNTMQRRIEEDTHTFMNAYGDKNEYDLKTIYFIYLAHIIRRWGRHESKSNNVNREFFLRSYDKIAGRRLKWLHEQVSCHFQRYDKHEQA